MAVWHTIRVGLSLFLAMVMAELTWFQQLPSFTSMTFQP